LSWDPKWKHELVGVAQGDAVDGEGDGIWSPQWPSGRDAIEPGAVGEWTSRWQARQASLDADESAAPDTKATSSSSLATPAATLGGWTPRAWSQDPAPTVDLAETSAPLQWPEPPADHDHESESESAESDHDHESESESAESEPDSEDLALPPERLQNFDDEPDPGPADEQTLFGAVPPRQRRRWGRRKD
jgi:hypothetical protein